MENAILEKEYKGYTVKIFVDNNPMNPRTERDNFGKMACFHGNYDLGDKHDFHDVEEFKDFIGKADIVALPLFLYDHSGITMRTTPFSCPWDSGQVGYIYATYEDIRKEYKVTRISAKLVDKVKDLLRSEVECYDRYLTGQVYGYQILKGEDIEDSCWGYYQDPDEIMEDCIKYDIQLEMELV